MNVRGGKIIIGFAFKTMYRILSIVIAFFMMPFLLRVLGDKMYGLWILSGAFLAYMGYLDLGISSAVARFVARAVGQKDIKEINEVVNTSFVIYIFIGLATLLVTIALIAFLALFIKSEPELSIMKFLVFILGLNLAIGFPSRAFGGIISANLRYEISEGILLTEFLLRSLLIVI
ncbi:MAG: MATE family efflux transporter, partial [Candidatus Staskawiczbacteria bacterium]|nr:MATE family efflux transporter [Candidatus Staskawiczbacteria bacterium]